MFRVVFRLQELPPFSEPSKNTFKPPFQAQMKPLKTGFGKIINNFYHFKSFFMLRTLHVLLKCTFTCSGIHLIDLLYQVLALTYYTIAMM